MNKKQIRNYPNESLNFAINDLMEVIEICESRGTNVTVQESEKHDQYLKDLSLCVDEKNRRRELTNQMEAA